ncbi:SHOCT domain-containing protein [Acrocarpospora catenulata]|uniref:SHOCT domain-containing protein n=1 Tax=Acrocarpospora catenulata TaxID=2836182 RepID=UPI001BDA4AA5|nr:SHOCT domain-containing protein [Acrocarpospora catenulata]
MTSTALFLGAAFLFLLSVIIGIVTVVVLSTRRRHPYPPLATDPREILRRRYAAGEIDEAEYQHRLSFLSENS